MLVPGAVVLLAMHIFWHPKYQPPRVIPVNHPTQLETWRHSSWTMYLSAFCLYSRTFHPNKTTSKLGIVDTKIIQNPRKLDTCRSQLRSFERQPYQPSYAPYAPRSSPRSSGGFRSRFGNVSHVEWNYEKWCFSNSGLLSCLVLLRGFPKSVLVAGRTQ